MADKYTKAELAAEQAAAAEAKSAAEKRRIANAQAMAQAAAPQVTVAPSLLDLYNQLKASTAASQQRAEARTTAVQEAQAAKVEAAGLQKQAEQTVQQTAVDVGGTTYQGKVYATSPDTIKWSGEGTSASPLTANGTAFTGVKDGVTYSNGIKTQQQSADKYLGGGTSDSPLTKNGVPFTGYWNGSQYVNGILQKVVSAGGQTFTGSTMSDNPAFLAAQKALEALGVTGLAEAMARIRTLYPTIDSQDALMLLKYDSRFNTPYLNRFAGNKMRMAAGLAPLDDAQYLQNEAAYAKIFGAYGLQTFQNRERYAQLIGLNKDPDEVATLVSLAYDRVIKGSPDTLKALNKLYPELTNADLVAYALDPKTTLPAFKRKIQAAEIGGAALTQGLSIANAPTTFTGAESAPYTNVTRGTIGVEAMMQSGADLTSAQTSAAYVAGVLPTAEKLSAIYGGAYDQYGQLQAEQEAYQGLASAKRAKEALRQREIAAFSGEKGTSQYSFLTETSI